MGKKKIVAIINTYASLFTFLIFCDHQDTESDSRGMEIGVVVPIFTGKNVNGSMGKQYL